MIKSIFSQANMLSSRPQCCIDDYLERNISASVLPVGCYGLQERILQIF